MLTEEVVLIEKIVNSTPTVLPHLFSDKIREVCDFYFDCQCIFGDIEQHFSQMKEKLQEKLNSIDNILNYLRTDEEGKMINQFLKDCAEIYSTKLYSFFKWGLHMGDWKCRYCDNDYDIKVELWFDGIDKNFRGFMREIRKRNREWNIYYLWSNSDNLKRLGAKPPIDPPNEIIEFVKTLASLKSKCFIKFRDFKHLIDALHTFTIVYDDRREKIISSLREFTLLVDKLIASIDDASKSVRFMARLRKSL
ncbi:MAG: hypothetical protein QW451_02840 [Candidatus Aenigmatarchaeota archaeon]